MLPRILLRLVGCAKAHRFYSREFEERDVSLSVFMRTWEKEAFRRVAVANTDRFAVDATQALSVLGQLWLQWVIQRPLLLFLADRMC